MVPVRFFSSKRPVNAVEDLVGMNMRIPGGVALDVAKSLGVVGVLTPVTEIYGSTNYPSRIKMPSPRCQAKWSPEGLEKASRLRRK